MSNVALRSNGARTLASTSLDKEHSPENILDGNERTFWMTTGLFPQQVIIQLPDPTFIHQISITSSNVQRVQFLGSMESSSPTNWELLGECELPDTDGRLQMESCTVSKGPASDINGQVQFVKVVISHGWDDFACVNQVAIISRD